MIAFLWEEVGLEDPEVVGLGAEAALVKGVVAGEPVVVKYRLEKSYRGRELDLKLRRERTILEARLLSKSRTIGVNVPQVVYVDADKGLLIMSFVEGVRLKDLMEKEANVEVLRRLFREAGAMVAILHKNGIVHGDLTTSNILVTRDGRLWLIDFGLGFFSHRDEDRGTDVHLMLRVLESTHPLLSSDLFAFFMEGYRGVAGDEFAERILKKMREIRMRGRYVATRRKGAPP